MRSTVTGLAPGTTSGAGVLAWPNAATEATSAHTTERAAAVFSMMSPLAIGPSAARAGRACARSSSSPARWRGGTGCTRQAHLVGANHSAFLHQDFRGREAALSVLEVDERQPARVGRRGFVVPAGGERVVDRADAVGITAAGHRAGGARLEVGQQRDAFLAVPRAFDQLAALCDQGGELVRDRRHLELEVADVRGLPRDARQEIRRQRRAGDRRVLDHDRDRDARPTTLAKNSTIACSGTRTVAP